MAAQTPTPAAGQALVPDEAYAGDNDSLFADSALGSDRSWMSSTASLSSSITRALEENGRKYHRYKEGKYVLPTDEQELERQAFQYELCLVTFDKHLLFAPAEKLNRILDCGCGLGYWALDFGEAHPETVVLGVDLSPVQPAYVPPNVHFEIDDLEEEWNFSYKFDLVHSLMMTGAFRDWPKFYAQSYEFLNPGGWLELQDMQFPLQCDDDSLRPNSQLRRWSDLMVEAGDRSGFSLMTTQKAAGIMRDIGFQDVRQIPFKWPINEWPKHPKWKEVGIRTCMNFSDGLSAMTMALFTRYLKWEKEEVDVFCAHVLKEFADPRVHAYFNLYVTYGRKL